MTWERIKRKLKDQLKFRHFNYGRVVKQIQYASYPASLGMINIGLYEYLKTRKATHFPSMNPQLFFFYAAWLFFFTSFFVGLGIGEYDEKSRSMQAFLIAMTFVIGIIFDLIGLAFLIP